MTTTVPTDDLVAHEPDGCVCGPAIVPIVTGQGERLQLTIHRRLDGQEPGHDEPDA